LLQRRRLRRAQVVFMGRSTRRDHQRRLAHPGHEGPSGALHFVASPFHAVLLAGAVIGGIALSVAARRSVARRKQAEARKR
ncbi:MAG: hypothetical protein AAFY22_03090, partial [Pseudomonadota bacterium]